MKKRLRKIRIFSFCTMITAVFICSHAIAQTDTTKVTITDTTVKATTETEKKADKKRKDEFIVYTGVNFNQLSVSSSAYESTMNIGFHLGAAYKRGKFFYWQVGGRFNYGQYDLTNVKYPTDSASTIAISSIDIPVTGGINFLAFVNRLVALRLFVSAVPSFNLGVSSNDVAVDKNNLNTFVLYGQGGIGVNVAFFILEAGYNYGFQDMFSTAESRPGQLFVNLGFRF